MSAQGRLGDLAHVAADAHGCPGCPHTAVGPGISGSPNVNVNSRPALRVGDNGIHAACCGPNLWTAVKGSATVFINGKPAHRMNDITQHCGGVGKLIQGSENVFVGDSTSAGARGGGGGLKTSPAKAGSGRAAPSGGGTADGGAAASSPEPQDPSGEPAPTQHASEKPPRSWIEIRVLDDARSPVPGMNCEILLPDGSTHVGVTDERGALRVDEMQRGACTVKFLDFGEDPPEAEANDDDGDPHRVTPGRPVQVDSDRSHAFRVTNCMTISFVRTAPDGSDASYPRYELKSTDGVYHKTLSSKDDLVPGDGYLQLKFDGLLPGRLYALTRHYDPEFYEEIFASSPYGEIVDQPRAVGEALIDHRYANFEMKLIE